MLPPTTCPTNSTEPFYIINTRENNAVGILYKDKDIVAAIEVDEVEPIFIARCTLLLVVGQFV